jgi:hypothetical protein
MSTKLTALVSAALAIPGISLAQTSPLPASLSLGYLQYEDSQRSGDRITVQSPLLSFQMPVGESSDLSGMMMYESISGASPLYLSTLSGASGLGVQDIRRSANGVFTNYFENFSLGVGGSFSNEDDYSSTGAVLENRIWTEDKNTVLNLSIGGDFDNIGSTNDPALLENRKTYSFLIGLTQIIDPISLAQTNLTYSSGDGYFSDPYKTYDNRPRSREEFAWLTRYVRYLEDTDSSLHLDYRFYRDTFGVNAHTFELAWYKPLGEVWIVRPNLRYYSQNRASFFSNGRFPEEAPERFFSADQRLASFGEWGLGVKVSRQILEKTTIDLSLQGFQQRSGFHLSSLYGEGGSGNIEPFFGWFTIISVTKNF